MSQVEEEDNTHEVVGREAIALQIVLLSHFCTGFPHRDAVDDERTACADANSQACTKSYRAFTRMARWQRNFRTAAVVWRHRRSRCPLPSTSTPNHASMLRERALSREGSYGFGYPHVTQLRCAEHLRSHLPLTTLPWVGGDQAQEAHQR